MKLIRLATEDPTIGNEDTARFDNNFNAELVLEPNSKIALLNCALDGIDGEIIIDDTNNKIGWSIGTTLNTITLNNRTYNTASHYILLIELENKLNATSGYTDNINDNPNEQGIQWKVSIFDQKVHIEYKLGVLADNKDNYNVEDSDVEIDVNGNDVVFCSTGNYESDTIAENAFLPNIVSKGMGLIRVQLGKLLSSPANDHNENGMIIGLSTNSFSIDDPSFINSSLDVSDLSYAIKVSAIDGGGGVDTYRYTTYKDGVATIEARTPAFFGDNSGSNDYIQVCINNGKVQIGIIESFINGDFFVFEEYDYDGEEELFPFIVFHTGSNYTRGRDFMTTISPFTPYSYIDVEQTLTTADTSPLRMPVLPIKTNNLLEFKSIKLANYLGFNTTYNGIYEAENSYLWVADLNFVSGGINDSFLVVLDNIQLDSYDGLVSQRNNILYTIDQSDNNGSLIYETPNLLFIDINNKSPIPLRNIKARILNNDYSPIKILQRGFMTIVITN
tara:strand:- start:2952 stop:4460 length:1509 start_codon:yes stop_codon:yes gene_type:complete